MNLNIYDYIDHKKVLSDFYNLSKSEDPKISHRYIAQRTGMSNGLFSKILSGKSTIPYDSIHRYSKLLKLNKKESEYFEVLVLYNQATENESKQSLFERIISLNRNDVQLLSFEYYEFYTKWYYAVLREILDCMHFKNNFKGLAQRMYPTITEQEAREGIALLERLRLIEKDEYGCYRKVDNFIYTGSEEHSFMLVNFATNMIDLAKESIENIPKDERYISWQTVSVDEKYYSEMVDEINNFRNRLMAIAQKSEDPNTVYQINLQLFPLTQK